MSEREHANDRDIVELEAEIERLREALRLLLADDAGWGDDAADDWWKDKIRAVLSNDCDHTDFHREGAYNVCDDCGASTKPEREP